MEKNIKINKKRSEIGSMKKKKEKMIGMGMSSIGKKVEREDNNDIRGMIKEV